MLGVGVQLILIRAHSLLRTQPGSKLFYDIRAFFCAVCEWATN